MTAVTPALAMTWAIETADSDLKSGAGSSLELDSAGNPHISYLHNSSGIWSLRYANKSGSAWTIKTVDPDVGYTNRFNHLTSLALTSAGNPRISYYNATPGDLMYAARTGNVWTTEVADSNSPYYYSWDKHGERNSLALDSAGYPRISYRYEHSGHPKLKYASWNGASWSNQTLGYPYSGSADMASDTSLAINASGTVFIASSNITGLWLFTSGGSWTSTQVDGPIYVDDLSMVLDRDGNPHIAYHDYTNQVLKYARRTAGGWSHENVYALGEAGEFNSLALDSAGYPHISFSDKTNYSVMYASKSGSSWTIENIDPGSDYLYPCTSLEMDSSDRPHISFWDYYGGVLKYAVGTPAVSDWHRIGVYRNSTHKFYLDKSGNGVWGIGDVSYNFGNTGDIPVTGDWNGDGASEIGVFRNSTHKFYLDTTGNGVWNTGDTMYSFGNSGDIPVTGDWNDDSTTEIGVYRSSTHTFYLDVSGNGVWGGGDTWYSFGNAGDLPVTGDWDNEGHTDIGVYRPSTHRFYLDKSGDGAWGSGDAWYSFGNTGDKPLIGDWNGNGILRIGVYRPSTRRFYLDVSGNGAWGSGDTWYTFGSAGDSPVAGKWG